MRRLLSLLVVVALAPAAAACAERRDGREAPAAAAGGAAVSALATYETYDVDAEGVTRTTRYQERFVRRGDQVWVERLFPAGMAPAAAANLHDIDLRVAARWFTRVGVDGVRVALVAAPERMIVELGPESLEGQGLSGRWTIAAALVDRSLLQPSTGAAAAAAPPGARWYQRSTAQGSLRVLWSERFELPLIVESDSANGRSRSSVALEPTPLAADAPVPWESLSGYSRRDLSDLGD